MADEVGSNKPRQAKARRADIVPVANIVPLAAVIPAVPASETAGEPAAAAVPARDFVQPEEIVQAETSPASVREPLSGPAATPVPINEGLPSMATIVPPSPAEAAEKAQAMFGDATARVKTAFERSGKLGEEMVDFAKGNVEALIASSRVAAKGAETMGQEAAEYGKKSFESAAAAVKSFATVKSPTELFTLQSDYAKASFDSLVTEASKLSEAWLKLAGEIAQPLSNRYALAAEKIKSATL